MEARCKKQNYNVEAEALYNNRLTNVKEQKMERITTYTLLKALYSKYKDCGNTTDSKMLAENPDKKQTV